MQVQLITATADEFMETFRRDVMRVLQNVNLEEEMSPHAKESYLREAEHLGEEYIQLEKYESQRCVPRV
jgi:hypothetical protein